MLAGLLLFVQAPMFELSASTVVNNTVVELLLDESCRIMLEYLERLATSFWSPDAENQWHLAALWDGPSIHESVLGDVHLQDEVGRPGSS